MADTSESLAQRIVSTALRSVVSRAPYLAPALDCMSMQSGRVDKGLLFATDGRRLVFDEEGLLDEVRRRSALPSREICHLVVHCLLLCPFQTKVDNREAFSLAADIVSEKIVDELMGTQDPSRGEAQVIVREQLLFDLGEPLTLERLYAAFCDGMWENMRDLWAQSFASDDHRLWSCNQRQQDTKSEPDELGLPGAQSPGAAHLAQASRGAQDSEAKARWRKISERAQTELKGRDRSAPAGTLVRELGTAIEPQVDLRQFLARFCRIRERERPSSIDFDPIFYTYGLSLFHDMPLIEAAELSSDRSLHTFVVALDTSASISSDQLARFAHIAFEVLERSGALLNGGRVHLIEADASVQSEVVISSHASLMRWLEDHRFVGGGGTDFRCVFDHVAKLKRVHAIKHLDGLIYLTDGEGIYPKAAPDYPVAFVLTPEAQDQTDTPSWALTCRAHESDLGIKARPTLWI